MLAAAFGLIAAAVYDAFRILRTFLGCGLQSHRAYSSLKLPLIGERRTEKRTLGNGKISNLLLIVTDALYGTVFAISITVFFYAYADGIVRWYTLSGVAVGFFVYMKTVGVVTKNAVGAIIFALETACRYIWYFAVKPFILLKKTYVKTVGRALGCILYRRGAALTEKYINSTLKRKYGEISSRISELDS